MKPNWDSRITNAFLLLSVLAVGLAGDLVAGGMVSDKAAKWVAIGIALFTRLQALVKGEVDPGVARLQADPSPTPKP